MFCGNLGLFFFLLLHFFSFFFVCLVAQGRLLHVLRQSMSVFFFLPLLMSGARTTGSAAVLDCVFTTVSLLLCLYYYVFTTVSSTALVLQLSPSLNVLTYVREIRHPGAPHTCMFDHSCANAHTTLSLSVNMCVHILTHHFLSIHMCKCPHNTLSQYICAHNHTTHSLTTCVQMLTQHTLYTCKRRQRGGRLDARTHFREVPLLPKSQGVCLLLPSFCSPTPPSRPRTTVPLPQSPPTVPKGRSAPK